MEQRITRRPKAKTHEASFTMRLPPAHREAISRLCEARADQPTLAQWVREAIAAKIKKDSGGKKDA